MFNQSSSTAQHSTAQHSTAQHSTAQHSTAQHIYSVKGLAGFIVVSATAAVMLTLAGCGATDPKTGGGTPGDGPGTTTPGTNPKTDWQDSVKELDSRLITSLDYNDEAVWVDVNKKVGTWEFRAYEWDGQLQGREARQEYVNGDYSYWEEWYTYDGKLYLQEIEWRSSDVRDTVRAIYLYAISAGQLTLTDSKGAKVTFVKINKDSLISVPQNAGHDSRLITNSGGGGGCDSDGNCTEYESYYWTSIKKSSPAEFLQWSFSFYESDYNDNYASNMKIDASSKVSYESFDAWYTIGNKLYILDFMGTPTEYTYSLSNGNNTLTLTRSGSTQTLRKMTFDEFFAELRPSALSGSGAAFDPALMGDWENWDDGNYFSFDNDGMAEFEIGNDYGIYWWYSRSGSVYLLHFVSGSAARTYTYSISGVTLTLSGSGRPLTLYMGGNPPSPDHDQKLITSRGYAWLPNTASERGGYRFDGDGDLYFNIYSDRTWGDSHGDGWHTSGDSLYMRVGPWIQTGNYWGGSEGAGGKYTVSANGNTLTFNGTYSYYDYSTGEEYIDEPISVTYTKKLTSDLPSRPDNYNYAPSSLGKSKASVSERSSRPRDIFAKLNKRPDSARR